MQVEARLVRPCTPGFESRHLHYIKVLKRLQRPKSLKALFVCPYPHRFWRGVGTKNPRGSSRAPEETRDARGRRIRRLAGGRVEKPVPLTARPLQNTDERGLLRKKSGERPLGRTHRSVRALRACASLASRTLLAERPMGALHQANARGFTLIRLMTFEMPDALQAASSAAWRSIQVDVVPFSVTVLPSTATSIERASCSARR